MPREAKPGKGAARLLQLRRALGLTQRELADEFQVTSGAIAHWETGVRPVPGPVLRLLELYEAELGPEPRPASQPMGPSSWRRGAPTAAGLALWLAARGAFGPKRRDTVGARVRLAAARNLLRTIGRHKGLSMKLGQMLGYLDLGLTEPEREIFGRLCSTATPMPPTAVTGQLLRAFGRTGRQLFARWSATPFAVGSIGQVHAATTFSGQSVAVKVQPPGIRAALEADLAPFELLGRGLSILFPAQRSGELWPEMRRHLLQECDYGAEAAHQRQFAARFSGDPDIAIPRVVDELTAGPVLTTERVAGMSLAAFSASAAPAARDRAGQAIWRYYFESALGDGLYNTDPQPDNLLFTSAGRVTFLDFGRVHRLEPRFVLLWQQLLRALLERDRDRVIAALIEMGTITELRGFDRDVAHRSMLLMYQPCLRDEPFAFDPDLLRAMWDAALARNTNVGRLHYTRDMVFFPQLAFGVNTVLARLGARVPCRRILLDRLYPPGAPRPAPFSDAEVAAAIA